MATHKMTFVFLVILFPVILLADNTFNPDQWLSFIDTFMAAPTWKALVGIIGLIAVCALTIARYFWKEDLRREEAFKKAEADRNKQSALLEQVQKDASAALRLNMDIVYKQDYDYFVKMIPLKKYPEVLLKIAPIYFDKIATFLYNETLTPEDRAARILLIIKK